MALDHLGRLAVAAGYATVAHEEFDLERGDDMSDARAATRFATPDAPAPRRPVSQARSTALVVAGPSWRPDATSYVAMARAALAGSLTHAMQNALRRVGVAAGSRGLPA